MRLMRTLAAALLSFAVLAGSAIAQDPPSREERIRRIHALPAEEKRRLKEALDRFNALPAAERDALRAKAKAVGLERLRELAGRDFESLRQRHRGIEAEIDEVFRLLGGPERLATLSPAEQAYLRAEATRNFQWHCVLTLLESARLASGFGQLPEAEKRQRKAQALEAMVQQLLAERTDAERERFRTLTPKEQRIARMELLAEWRMRQTPAFARRFDVNRLLPLLQKSPEERGRLIAKRVRWFQIASLLAADGVDRETMRMFEQLGADERGQVGDFYGERRDAPVAERRAAAEQKIRELYGKGAVEPSRQRRPHLRHLELLRDRQPRERGEPAPGDAPPK